MKIASRLLLATGITALIAVLMIASIAWTQIQVIHAQGARSLVDEIFRAQTERELLRDDYILRREPSSAAQWELKTAEFSKLLDRADADLTSKEERFLLAEIRSEFESTKAFFGALSRVVDASIAREPFRLSYGEADTLFFGQYLMRSYSVHDGIVQLRRLESATVDAAVARGTLIALFAILLGTLAIGSNYSRLGRHFARRVAAIEGDLRLIGKGDLDHRLESAGDDEFAMLARAVNEMAGQLKGSHASIDELRNEMARREKAESGQRRFSTIIDESMNEIYVFDETSLRFTYVNRSVVGNIGYSYEELLGMTPVDIKPEFTKESFLAMIAPLVDGSEKRLAFRTVHRRKDGTSYPVEVRLQLYRDPNGDFFFAIIDDLSDRLRAEELRLKTLDEKEALLRELYHRTRNNMQIIMAMLDAESELAGSPEVTDLVKRTNARILSMALVHGKLYENESLSTIDLGSYCRDLTSLIEGDNPGGEVRIVITNDCEPVSASVETAVPFGLALHELVSNAVRHAYPDGRAGEIRVTLRKSPKGTIELLVADDGVGLPSSLESRLEETLGLQLVHTLIEGQLHGRLWFENDAGLHWHASFEDGHGEAEPKDNGG